MSTPERQGMSTKRSSGPPKPGLRFGAAVAVLFAVLSALFAAVALAAKPQYVLPPQIGGKARLGERLVCGSGTWKGAPHFEYQWVREGIETTKGPSYTLSKADEHKEVWCVVTAIETVNGVTESSTAESVNSICLAGPCGGPPPEPLGVKVKPKVSGSATVGSLLSCSQGEWSGRPAPTFAYKWLRDKSEPIKGATSASYTVAAEDETHALSCRVTASNGLEELNAESENSVTVPGTAPKNTTVPAVLGEPSVNEALTCYEGTWSGSKPLTYEFRWLRNGTEIPIATGSTYIVEAADEGQALSCRVTASNGLGKAEKVSAARTVAGKLRSTEAPKIIGTPEETHTLSCSEGAWNQSELTFKYQWLRESVTILGATSKEYQVANADRGRLLYCQVVARNKKGEEVHVTSEPFGIRNGPGVPKNGVPVVTGEPLEAGHTLTCEHGNWTGVGPFSYVYQWQREESAIAGATGSTYKLTSADEGTLISCRVIAQNSEGPSEAAESAGRSVKGEKPTVTSAPEVYPAAEAARAGQSLTCLRGEWTGAPTPTFEYEWLRDGSTRVGPNASYTITTADRGHELSCNVTAKNK
jgi:hypothetical protein